MDQGNQKSMQDLYIRRKIILVLRSLILLMAFYSSGFFLLDAAPKTHINRIGVYHQNPRLHPHEYQSETDRFILSLIRYGCSPTRYSGDSFQANWSQEEASAGKVILRYHADAGKLRSSWQKLLHPAYFNPRRLVIKKIPGEKFTDESVFVSLKRDSFQEFLLMSAALQPVEPLLEQIEWLDTNRYRIDLSGPSQDGCLLVSYDSRKQLLDDWKEGKLDGVFTGDLESVEGFTYKKVIDYGSDTLMYIKFSDWFKGKDKLKQAISFAVPKRKIAEPYQLKLLPADGRVPAFFRESRSKYRSSYNSYRARKLLQGKKVPMHLFVAYPELDGVLETAVKRVFKEIEATTGIRFIRTAYDSMNQGQTVHIRIEFADLDHGRLVDLWKEACEGDVRKSGRDLWQLDHACLYHQKGESDFSPLWWFRNPLLMRD